MLALAGVGAAAGYLLERVAARRLWPPHDPAVVEALQRPLEEARHHHVPTDDGGELHVLERGEGRPLVFLHGVTLSTMAWHYQLAELGDRYRVLAVDHRGHGLSKHGRDPYTIERLAKDFGDLLEAFDLHDVVVIGHSMGGMAALQYAVENPEALAERVAGLVLVSTAAGPLRRLVAFKAVTRLVSPSARYGLKLADRVPGGMFASNDLSWLIFRLGHGRDPSPDHIELNRLMTAATPVSVLAELVGGILGFDVRHRLSEIDVPALVVVGSRDILTPLATAETVAEGLPNAEFVVFDGVGHMPMLQRRDEVTRLIERFVENLPSTPRSPRGSLRDRATSPPAGPDPPI